MHRPSAPIYEQLLQRAQNFESGPKAHPSTAVVPWRRGADGELEVYWVRRSPALRFMAGWHAFPGGGWSRHDVGIQVAGMPKGVVDGQITDPEPEIDAARREQLGPDLTPGLLVATARELFEETGLPLVSEGLETSISEDRRQEIRLLRQHLLNDKLDFAEVLERLGWTLSAEGLVFAGRWLTPPFAPRRFDNRFFLLEWPAAEKLQPEVHVAGLERQELAAGEWLAPARARARWESGEVMAADRKSVV